MPCDVATPICLDQFSANIFGVDQQVVQIGPGTEGEDRVVLEQQQVVVR